MPRNDATPNERSPSTTWEWRKVKIALPPEAPSQNVSKRPSLRSHSPSERRRPLGVTITARGGAEAWWEVRSRGRVWRFPGWWSIDDVFSRIHDGR